MAGNSAEPGRPVTGKGGRGSSTEPWLPAWLPGGPAEFLSGRNPHSGIGVETRVSDYQAAVCGRFAGPPVRGEMERFFCCDLLTEANKVTDQSGPGRRFKTSDMVTQQAGGSPLPEVRDLSKHFGGVRALVRASLQLAAGTTVALAGESGAGKSTLIKILSRAIRPDLTRGAARPLPGRARGPAAVRWRSAGSRYCAPGRTPGRSPLECEPGRSGSGRAPRRRCRPAPGRSGSRLLPPLLPRVAALVEFVLQSASYLPKLFRKLTQPLDIVGRERSQSSHRESP